MRLGFAWFALNDLKSVTLFHSRGRWGTRLHGSRIDTFERAADNRR